MFSTLRNRFGIPGVISVIALVFALVGGAFAANNLGDSGKDATASAKKSIKGPRGPRGPKGATGDAGPAGPAGLAGAKGDTGAAGAAGATGPAGSAGANGKTVLSGTTAPNVGIGTIGDFYINTATHEIYGPKKETGANGGWGAATLLKGAKGDKGDPGEPWVVGTAPSGALMKGTWAAHSSAAAAGEQIPVSISFTVPIPAPSPGNVPVVVVPPGGPDPFGFGCDGSADAPTPSTVSAGILCVYTKASTNFDPSAAFGTTVVETSGGGLVFRAQAINAALVDAYGSWVFVVP